MPNNYQLQSWDYRLGTALIEFYRTLKFENRDFVDTCAELQTAILEWGDNLGITPEPAVIELPDQSPALTEQPMLTTSPSVSEPSPNDSEQSLIGDKYFISTVVRYYRAMHSSDPGQKEIVLREMDRVITAICQAAQVPLNPDTPGMPIEPDNPILKTVLSRAENLAKKDWSQDPPRSWRGH